VVQGKEAATAGDLTRFLEADRELHLRLIRPLANRRLNEILGRLRDETRLYGLRELVKDGLLVASAEEHERLLDAVEVGDVNAMRDEMTRHLSHTRGAWAARSECTD
jgi:DNA-binding GntR family transcriptional regulator